MIKCLKKFEFDHVVNQARSVELKIDGKDYILFCVSQNKGLDPWPEAFGYIDYPLSMVMFDKEGNKIWTRTFGRGTIPGVWFTPFIAFDLDKDGKDVSKEEITAKCEIILKYKDELFKLLKNKSKINFTDLFEIVSKDYVVVTFLAVLEMAKNKEIKLIMKI